MKKIQTLSLLLEQAELDGTKIELTGNAVTMTIKDKVRIKWPYLYSWPAKNPLLGDMENFVKVLNASTKGAGQSILSQIEGSDGDKSHYVGIARNETSTQNNRLLRKDLGEVKGWVYLFYPNTIDETLVPDTKKLPAVDGRFTFIMDSEFKKYLKTGTSTQSASNSQSGNSTKPDTNINKMKASALVDPDGTAYDWYNDENGIRIKYLNPVVAKIGKSTVTITKSGKITPIFWQFVAGLPEGLSTPAPSTPVGLELYNEELQSAIKGLFTAASKYDSDNFSTVNTNNLTSDLYSTMVKALTLLGLNSGKIDINLTPDRAGLGSKPYYRSMTAAAAAAGAVVVTPDANSGSATFDGTNITTEDQVLKIFAGVVVSDKTTWGTPDVSTIDKVKTYFKTNMNKNSAGSYENMFAAIKKFSGFKHGQTYSGSKGFKDFESVVKGTNSGKFDDSLLTIIKSAITASPIK
jgi:hypothetical protein